jgi:hypothetical protein
VTTFRCQDRDKASKNRAKASKDKDEDKSTKLFPQFEHKQGSPRMTHLGFGEAAVVNVGTSDRLRYIVADDRYALRRSLLLIYTDDGTF